MSTSVKENHQKSVFVRKSADDSESLKTALKFLSEARKLESDFLRQGIDCANNHIQNVDSDWLDKWE
jgi:hypothetical protein